MAEPPLRTEHDLLFKERLQTFLREFLELFLPEAAGILDLSRCRFLTQELFNDLPGGRRQVVDVVAEATLRNEPGAVLIHVQHQGYPQAHFNERMFHYFSRLYDKYRQRILPMAIFAYDQLREEPDGFEMVFGFLEVLRFRFHKIELRRLPWREFIRTDNPVAAALLSKMNYRFEERVQVKMEFLRMLTRMELDPARLDLLGGFFETYLRLSPAEEEDLLGRLGTLEREEARKVLQITTSWHERGRKEGRMEGRVEAKQEAIVEYLTARFGFDPAEAEERVGGLQNLETLNRLLNGLYGAQTAEEALGLLQAAQG